MNKLNILYEDNHIIVVEKKPNVLCQSDYTNDLDLLTMVKSYVKEKYNKPGNVYLGLVHRLDRPVGGIMVFARTSKAAARLSKYIQNHEMKKEYLLVCEGKLDDSGYFEDYIEKRDTISVISNEAHGKYSKLEYEVLSRKENFNLVRVNLITGRHHQIRLQFASRNHPLYGDQLYGKQDKKQIALYAYHLSFKHPVKDEIMDFKLIPQGGIWSEFSYEA
ncbi:MAG: RluA family pseudouridine synthase [Bacilli bacterium]|nr:RluA family pseudouridine synthase [Bacilli bacterium]